MSEENVEIVRHCYEAFAQHRFPSEQFADEIEWTTSPELPDAGTYRGRENLRRYFAEWVAGWAEVRNDPNELIDAGDRVVAMVHGTFRLMENARPFERDYAQLWRLRAGLVISVRVYADPAEALEAAGLSE
jgi:ketosteroid isomerase-like protein